MADVTRQAIAWREVPWTIKAYGGAYLIGAISFSALGDRPFGSVIFSLVVVSLLVWGMARRSRVAWIVALIFAGLGVVFGSLGIAGRLVRGRDVEMPLEVIQVGIVVVSLTLLAHPRTREWCRLKLRLVE